VALTLEAHARARFCSGVVKVATTSPTSGQTCPLSAASGLITLTAAVILEATAYHRYFEEEDGGTLYQTWATWTELKHMDLNEVGVDERARRYKRAPDGSLVDQHEKGLAPNTPENLYPGLTWERQDTVYKIHTITRREIFDEATGWHMLFDMMKTLERNWKDTDIRLVIWFW